jgi:hypothetical protein
MNDLELKPEDLKSLSYYPFSILSSQLTYEAPGTFSRSIKGRDR